MTEHPLFIPYASGHLAAIVAIPPEPRGLVLMLQGMGNEPRSHRNKAWTKTARALADRGIASVRMDYPGLGDSTGEARLELDSPPADEARAVLSVAQRVTGVSTFAIVGNCVGTRTALQLASRVPGCTSVVSVLPMSLKPLYSRGRKGVERARRAAGNRLPTLRAAVRRLRTTEMKPKADVHSVLPDVHDAARIGSLLFLHGGTDESRAWLDALAAELRTYAPGDARDGIQVWRLPTEGGGFRALETQQAVVDGVVRWMDLHFPSEAAADAVVGAAPIPVQRSESSPVAAVAQSTQRHTTGGGSRARVQRTRHVRRDV